MTQHTYRRYDYLLSPLAFWVWAIHKAIKENVFVKRGFYICLLPPCYRVQRGWGWNFKELLRNNLRFTCGWADVLCMAHFVQILKWEAWPELFCMYLPVFWIRIRNPMFLGLLDPHPDPDPSINKQKMKKNLDFYCFVTSFWLFIFEEWCKCTFKRNKHKNLVNKNLFCWHLEGHWRKEQGPESDLHPDPLVKGTDPRIRSRIRILTKMSPIRKMVPTMCMHMYYVAHKS
jgi:hypothetical protein